TAGVLLSTGRLRCTQENGGASKVPAGRTVLSPSADKPDARAKGVRRSRQAGGWTWPGTAVMSRAETRLRRSVPTAILRDPARSARAPLPWRGHIVSCRRSQAPQSRNDGTSADGGD